MDEENRIESEDSRRLRLRQQMIRQTEQYIDGHLGDQEVPWPGHYEPGNHGRMGAEMFARAKPTPET
jgi:hypothetical protein